MKQFGITGILGLALALGSGALAADWPIFRGDRGLTGVAPGKLPDQLTLLWKYKFAKFSKASAVIADGQVFIGGDDGNLTAINLATGKKTWEFKTKDPFEAPAMLLDGRVYVGNLFGNFYALDAKTGNQLWEFETGSQIVGGANWTLAPNGKDKYVLVGSHDNFLYCLNAKDGKKVWEIECDQPINGSPSLTNGRTMFGGCDAMLHLINVKAGKEQAAIDAGSYIIASVAAAGNQAFVGHRDNEFLAFDLKKQKVLWTYKDRLFPYESSAAVTKDRVLFGGGDKRLHCVRRDNGKVVWTFSTRGAVDSSPVVCGDKVLVGSNDGRLYMVNLKTGKPIWSYETDDAITASPAVAGGKVVIGSEDGFVYCFGTKGK